MKMSLVLYKLHPHPCGAIFNASSSLQCSIHRQETLLSLHYTYEYDHALGPLKYENHKPKHFHPTLWKQTCFEFFLRDASTGRYWEWNFLPSGAWGAFAFESERKPCIHTDALLEAAPRNIQSYTAITATDRTRLDLHVTIDVGFSPLLLWHFAVESTRLQAAYTAVIAHETQAIQYWSAQHAHRDKADFHAPQGFFKV
jgi:hypothetical protein